MFAAGNGHEATSATLLDHRAAVDLQGEDVRHQVTNTALMWAATKGHKGTVTILLEHGAQRNLQNQEPTSYFS